MKGLNSVNWSVLLTPDGEIPHDVCFKVITKNSAELNKSTEGELSNSCQSRSDDQAITSSIPAHKLLLASVSPVFKRQLYGSIPTGEEVKILDSTVDAFKMMIDYVYQKEDMTVENLDDVKELFNVYYLAEKYEVLGWKEKILKRFNVMDVDTRQYEAMLKSLLQYDCFEDACKVIEKRVIDFIKVHSQPLELVQAATSCEKEAVKRELMDRLVSVEDDSILETVEAIHNIFNSDSSFLEETTIVPVMKSCVRKFKVLKKDPLKFSQLVPDPGADLLHAFHRLLQYIKSNFCKNCESSSCHQGETIDEAEIRVGARVLVNKLKKGWFVKAEQKSTVHIDDKWSGPLVCPYHLSEYCPVWNCPFKNYICCPFCKYQKRPFEVSNNCDGIHGTADVKSSLTVSGQFSVLMEIGQEVITRNITDVNDVVYNC